jgi:hypothetical protein
MAWCFVKHRDNFTFTLYGVMAYSKANNRTILKNVDKQLSNPEYVSTLYVLDHPVIRISYILTHMVKIFRGW